MSLTCLPPLGELLLFSVDTFCSAMFRSFFFLCLNSMMSILSKLSSLFLSPSHSWFWMLFYLDFNAISKMSKSNDTVLISWFICPAVFDLSICTFFQSTSAPWQLYSALCLQSLCCWHLLDIFATIFQNFSMTWHSWSNILHRFHVSLLPSYISPLCILYRSPVPHYSTFLLIHKRGKRLSIQTPWCSKLSYICMDA